MEIFAALSVITATVMLWALTQVRKLRNKSKLLELRLSQGAFHDDLTGLASRSLFLDRVSHSLSRRSLDPDHPIAVLLVDLDDFRNVNDSVGHSVGDEILKAVAERMQGCLRVSDTAARLGGDEFGVLIEEMHFPEDAEMVAERLLTAMSRPFRGANRDVPLAASIGIAISSTGLSSAEELLRNSDLAMRIAKRDRTGFTKYGPNMASAAPPRQRTDLTLP